MHRKISILLLLFSFIFYGCHNDRADVQKVVKHIKLNKQNLQQIGEHVTTDPTSDAYKEAKSDEFPLPYSNIKNANPSLLEAKRILTELTPVYLYMSHVEVVDLNNDGQPEIIGQFSHADPSESGFERFYIAKFEQKRWIRDASYHYSELENCESSYQYQIGEIDNNEIGMILTCNEQHKYVLTLVGNKLMLWRYTSFSKG